ncbi:MAG: ABC transporter ATP-binding protein [Clostridia bacterium]|nr:ABC transporter ATP-binding protein [Clostridia bacterium]
MEPLLQVKDLKVSFFTYAGEVHAVRGVNWELGRKETIAIVGESGCGKTVSIQTAMGLLKTPPGRVMSGEILYEGKDILKLMPQDMRQIQGNGMSMIFQDPLTYLNPTMRVGDQIAEVYLQHHKGERRKAHERVLEMMRLVSLPDPEQNMKRYPHQLSGGMRQRVMVAMALIGDPKVLFADEPTTALDVTIQAQIIDLMNELKEKLATSIVLITHDLGVVAKMAERVYVMYAGQIVEHGDAVTIFENPKHPYTKALLASSPRLDAANKAELASIPGTPPDLLAPPEGCAFAARCRYAMNICARLMPSYTEFAEEGHYAACWLCQKAEREGGHE